MNPKREIYDAYVSHPRFGKRPQITGRNPAEDGSKVRFHWCSSRKDRIPYTAITANVARQSHCISANSYSYFDRVTHYFDEKRVCRNCGRPFIFFAEEQKHWYEDLQIPLDVTCVRCAPCRKRSQGIARLRERYIEFCQLRTPSIIQIIGFADCCLDLIARGAMTAKQFQRIRTMLNRVPKAERTNPEYLRVRSRLTALEEKIART